MAFGTLAFDTLQTSDSKNTGTSKTLDTSYVYNGSAKAWVRGTDAASVTTSLNITSGTDSGTGTYEYSITNSFSDANYVQHTTAETGNGDLSGTKNTASHNASTFATELATGGAKTDTAHCISGHGDLA